MGANDSFGRSLGSKVRLLPSERMGLSHRNRILEKKDAFSS